MKLGRNQVSERLDRVLRTQHVGGVLLLLGAAAFFLGIGVVLLTVQYTPEQLGAIMRVRPWTQDIFLLLPAPEHYRLLGVGSALAGIALFALGGLVRDDQWWY